MFADLCIFPAYVKYKFLLLLCPAIASLGLAAVVVSVVSVNLLNTIVTEHVIKDGIFSRLVLHFFGFVTNISKIILHESCS